MDGVAYTPGGFAVTLPAVLPFSSSGGGSPVVVSGLGNGTTAVNLTGLGDGTITAAVSVTDTAHNTARDNGDTRVKETVGHAAPTTLAVTNDRDALINNPEKADLR